MSNKWPILKVRDYPITIIDGDRGVNYPKKSEFSDQGYCVFLNTGNVSSDGFKFENVAFITEEKHKSLRKGLLKRNDCVLTTRGTIGNVAFYSKKIPYSCVRINSGMLILRPDTTRLQPEFFIQLMKSDVLQQQALLYKFGAAQPQLPISTFRHIQLPLPPLHTQQKIAHILSAYDDLIENNLKRITLLEEMAQITYEEWFVRMKFPGHENTPVDAETGLPEGWEELAISEICTVNGNSISKKNAPETINYIDISSVNTGHYEIPQPLDFASAPSRARRKVKYGDTIFSTVRPNRKIYTLILEDDPLLVVSTGFATLTPKIDDSFSFVYLSVANQSFVDKAVSVAGGAAYPAVNQSDFEKIKITTPTSDLVREFSDNFNQSFRLIGNLQKQNRSLKEARDILLPRLMTGLINVDDIDLPTPKPHQETA